MTDASRLLPETLPADPMPLVAAWLTEAKTKRVQPHPEAMTLATANADGRHGCLACLDVDLWKAHACPSEMVTLRVCDQIQVICLVDSGTPLAP